MSEGRLSSDIREIQERSVEFYSDSYKADKCDNDCVDPLQSYLPKLALDDNDMLDLPLTLEKLKTAVFQMSLGCAPRTGGLPVGFYKTFWDRIGQDLLSVLSASCLVKVDVGLARPITLGKGVRQGCAMLDQLFSLAIETVLILIWKKVMGTASTAKVDWGKSGVLLCGPWSSTEPPQLPRGLLWSKTGQRWLKAAVLYLPTHEGGQGLINRESRVAAFRLKAAQQLLYYSDLCWRETTHALLRKAGKHGT
ncbi:hypothetical protein SRHO_G00131060 [Serrasalmus rhombeus]